MLHGRHEDFLKAIVLHCFALGILTNDRGDLINSNFGGFLEEPFKTSYVFRRGNGNMDMKGLPLLVGVGISDLDQASFRVVFHKLSRMPVPLAISQVYQVTGFHSQDANAML